MSPSGALRSLAQALRNVGLRARLVLIIAAACIPLLLLGYMDVTREIRDNRWTASERAHSDAALASSRIEERIRTLTLTARFIAARAVAEGSGTSDLGAFLATLKPMLGRDVTRVRMVDAGGRVLGALWPDPGGTGASRYPEATWFNLALKTGSPQVSGIEFSPRTGRPELTLAYPATISNGDVRTVVIAAIDLTTLANSIVGDLFRGRLLIISDGAGAQVGRIATGDEEEPARTLDQAVAGPGFISGELQWRGESWTTEVEGHEYAFRTSRIGTLPWQVAVGTPEAEILRYASDRVWTAGIQVLILCLLAGSLAFFSMWSLVRPLAAIRVGLQRFVGGETGVQVPVLGHGEIALLERDFNRMTAQADRDRAALSESEARYRSLTELSADWQWETDDEHRVTFMSEVIDGVPYRNRDKVMNRRRWEAMGTDPDAPYWQAHIADLGARRPFRNFEYARTTDEGEVRWVSLNGGPIFDAAGAFLGYRGTGRWITARVLAETHEREAKERYRQLTELSNDWFWETDAEHRFAELAKNVEQATGVRHLGLRRWELAGVDAGAPCWATHREDLAARRTFRDFEFSRVAHDGSSVWCAISGTPILGSDGGFLGYRGTGRYVTARVEAERVIRHSAERLGLMAENLPAMIAYLNPDTRVQYANGAYAEFFGAQGFGPVGKRVEELIGAEAWVQVAPIFERAIAGTPQSYETQRRGSDNEWHDLEVTLRPHLGSDGKAVGLYTFFLDVTAKRRASQALQLRNRALDASVSAVMITGHAVSGLRIEYVNRAFERMTGYGAGEVIGRNPRFLHRGHAEQPGIEALRLAVRETRECTVLLHNVRKDGTLFWNELHVAPVRDESGWVTHFIGASADVTERVEHEQELERHATLDSLTGLPNRSLLQDRLEQAMVQAGRAGTMTAVLYVDVDHFKRVNDSAGHLAGDRVIRAVAERIAGAVRGGDTVARMGGDEFVVVLADVKHEADAMRVAQKLRAAVAAPLHVEQHEYFLSASVGIAMTPKDGADAETLMRNADTALYRAKEEGRDCAWFFTADLNDRALRFIAMDAELRRALAARAFELHYQPIVRLRDGAWVGAEALLRLRRADGTMVSPAHFIPVAEDSGLILQIGRWVIDSAVRQAAAWQPKQGAPFVVAINLSARQFRDPGLVELVRDTISGAGISPLAIKLEITESTVMHNADEASEILRDLRALGVHLSIDDFGTGYSSLAYLKRFPISTLKLDRSFVSGLPDDANDMAISHGVVNLAHGLKLDVVAEGIETFAQAETLDRLNCEYAQGFLFSPPVAVARFDELRKVAKVVRGKPGKPEG